MHLLYLDDSGSAENQNEDYLVLGGISLHENQVAYVTRELDKLAERIAPSNPDSVEFHASEIYSGRNHPWKNRKPEDKRETIKAVLKIAADAYATACAFACAIHKDSFPGEDPMALAFEDLCSRFDKYLTRRTNNNDPQRGIIIIDKSAQETSLQRLAKEFRVNGTRWGGSIQRLAEAPLFIDSKASRCVQLADHIAYAVFRRYNAGDTNYFDVIAHRFDLAEGVVHGLVHKHKNQSICMCPACMSRRPTTISP